MAAGAGSRAAGGPAAPAAAVLALALVLLGLPATPAAAQAGRLLVASDADGDFDLYTMPAGGGALTRVTDLGGSESAPEWSPDGMRVAFANGDRIYLVDPDGADLVQVTTFQTRHPTWSPDGTQIAFQGHDGDGDFDLFVAGADGSNPTELADNAVADLEPDWGPDGIVLARGTGTTAQVVVVDPATGADTAAWDVPNARHPAWSPDGAQIAVSQATASGGFARIAVLDVATGTVTALTDGTTADRNPAWSPDGTQIAFTRNPDPPPGGSGTGDIWTMNADGTGQAALTSAAYHVVSPDWEPAPPPAGAGVAETVAVSDTVTITVGLTLPVAEQVAVTDSVTVTVGAAVQVGEQIAVTDTVRVAVGVSVPVAEQVAVTDTVTVLVQASVPVAEQVAVTDTVRIAVAATVPLAEGVGVTDTVTVTVHDPLAGVITGPDGEELTQAFPGEEITLSAGGFEPGSPVDVELHSDPILLATTVAGEDGGIEVTLTLPTGIQPGEHALVAVGVDPAGQPHQVSAPLTILDPAPQVVEVGTPEPVQYSDSLVPVTVEVADPDSPVADLSVVLGGAPAGLAAGPLTCEDDGGTTVCTTTIGGVVTAPAGLYEATVTVTDGANQDTVTVIVTVLPEGGAVDLDPGNTTAEQVTAPGGDSGPFTLAAKARERSPDTGFQPQPGDVSLAGLSISLHPLGPGAAVAGDCTATGDSTHQEATCTFDGVPVGTYAVLAQLDGLFFAGLAEDVLTVYDPSLGFTSGGGWFTWPGTATPDGYAGDRVTFGYTMKYNRKGTNVQGQFLLVRHLPDGTVIRVRSNALDGLAVSPPDAEVPWASFSGKATFAADGVEQGNHTFSVYVEDHGQPGGGADRIWIEVRDATGTIIEQASLPWAPTDEAVTLGGGNIVVPHESGSRRRGKR